MLPTLRLFPAIALFALALPASAATVTRVEVQGLADEAMRENVLSALSLQDELGAWNDAAVAASLAASLAGPAAPSAAAVAGWAAARPAARSDTLAAAWAGFAEATPFWSSP